MILGADLQAADDRSRLDLVDGDSQLGRIAARSRVFAESVGDLGIELGLEARHRAFIAQIAYSPRMKPIGYVTATTSPFGFGKRQAFERSEMHAASITLFSDSLSTATFSTRPLSSMVKRSSTLPASVGSRFNACS